MTRSKPTAPRTSSSEASCHTVTTSGGEASSGVGLEDMLESLHLHLNTRTPNLNKLKLRCRAEHATIGKTKNECKENLQIAYLRLDPATPNLNKYRLSCQAEGVPVGRTLNDCKANLATRKPQIAKSRERSEISAEGVAVFFVETYGNDETRLDMWQKLCRDLGRPVGPSITQCKKIVEATFVNIYDYVDAMKRKKPVKLFATHAELREDALGTGEDKVVKFDRIYPKPAAKASFFLKALLKEMMSRARRVRRV